MPQNTLTIHVAPPHGVIDEIVAGSEMRFSILVREEVFPATVPKTYTPFDFVGYTLLGHVKSSVASPTVLEIMSLTSPGVDGVGYVDVLLTAAQTTDLGKGCFVGSIKAWPAGDPDAAFTVLTLTMPVELEATW